MISYAERHRFSSKAVALWESASALVELLPHTDEQGREVRCHEVARVLGKVLNLEVVDGASVGVDHSWLIIDRTTLLDPYVPGRLPMVQLIDIGSPTLLRLCYASELNGKPRADIRQEVIDFLERGGH